MPPALNITNPIRDLRVVEYGDRLIADFTIPPLTTEGLVVKRLGDVQLVIGVGANPFDTNQWAARAATFPVKAFQTGPGQADVPAADWVGKQVVIGVRVINPKGRSSDWSNLVSLNVIPPVPSPANVTPHSAEQGARITWTGSGTTFRVFRRGPGDKEPALVGTAEKLEYIDATAQFGTAYEYRVQAVQDQAESAISSAASITPRDEFPPVVPAGLTVVVGAGTVELVWERNTEADLKGYRIYRSTGDGPLERLADLVDTPTYSDKQIELGKKYKYAISAIDQNGNESKTCSPVEATAS